MDDRRAANADEALDIVLAAAARQVSAEGCDVEEAIRNHFRIAHERWPEAWALVAERLQETGNEEMLAYMEDRDE
jgi:hypothetical protein